MPAKKAKAKKTVAATRKRLTPETREAIAKESPDLTLAVLAEKYDTSINTIAKYRNAGSARSSESKAAPAVQAKRAAASGNMVTIPIQAKFDGGQLTFSFSRKELLQILADTE